MARGGPTFHRINIRDDIDLMDAEIKKNDDGTYASTQTWTGITVSGGQALPAPSATAWLKADIGGTDYYLPLFNTYW